MNNVMTIHRKAMEWADKGQSLLDRGDQAAAREAFRKAMELERQAACTPNVGEPDRSVLFRSAGSLALECNETRTAEQLFAMGLAGNPPDEIAEEIRDLLEQTNFRRHLEVRGTVLAPNDVQMSIAGSAVSHGMASSDDILLRVQDFEKLIVRTAERKTGHPYRERGGLRGDMKDSFGLFLSIPRAASYAVTLRIGHSHRQMKLWKDVDGKDVIDEVLDLLEIVQIQGPDELSRRIDDDAYLRNFKALAKKIAPDGERVSMVGITSRRHDRSREIALTKTRRELTVKTPNHEHAIEVEGTLYYADGTSYKAGIIKLKDQEGRQHRINVPIGMMVDIVRPLWDRVVWVRGTQKGANIDLEDISPADIR